MPYVRVDEFRISLEPEAAKMGDSRKLIGTIGKSRYSVHDLMVFDAEPVQDVLRHAEHRVDRLEAGLAEQ